MTDRLQIAASIAVALVSNWKKTNDELQPWCRDYPKEIAEHSLTIADALLEAERVPGNGEKKTDCVDNALLPKPTEFVPVLVVNKTFNAILRSSVPNTLGLFTAGCLVCATPITRDGEPTGKWAISRPNITCFPPVDGSELCAITDADMQAAY